MNRQLVERVLNCGACISVVGDIILDRYTWGSAMRVSPEAPVTVLEADSEEVRLGGAAAVAMLLANLGARIGVHTVLLQSAYWQASGLQATPTAVRDDLKSAADYILRHSYDG